MLTEFASVKNVREKLLSREEFHPYPKYNEREAWEKFPASYRKVFLEKKQEVMDFSIPPILASQYMDYYRTGSAPKYNAGIRRTILFQAMMIECLEGKGELIDKIIDLVWAICEESSWIHPGHNNHMHNYMWSGVMKNALPDVTDFNFIDLAAGVTASVLTWVYYFLRDRLDEESPLVCKRIELELYKRIIIPFMHHDDLTWFGCYGHKINNWNPWILEKIMPLAMVTVKDPDLQAEYIARCMEKLDIYAEDCNPDGGCDEGPGYWGMAGASLFDCLEELYLFTGGKLNFFDWPVIKNCGEYIVKARVCGNEYVNFADNGHNQQQDAVMLYRFSKYVNSPRLQAAATSMEVAYTADEGSDPFRKLQNFCALEEFQKAPRLPDIPQDDWLPDTEILYARDKKNQLTAAAKGGFNNESHNHNDLGNFICSYNGQQIFIDLGAPMYTAKTFSPYRYEIWIVQSAWHNCAKLNGFDQHDGDDYKAQILDCQLGEEITTLSMELKGAYVPEAGIESYIRTFTMDKENSVWTVTDDVKMKEPSEIETHFISINEPKIFADHVEIPVDETHTAIVTFDADKMACTMDTHAFDHESRWQYWERDIVYRIHLTSKEKHSALKTAVSVQVVEK